MTFADWLTESAHRFRTQPPTRAAKESAAAFARGAFRHVGEHIGTDVWSRGDWDVLVILDACRADLWQEVAPEYDLPAGAIVWSNAACSIDWIERTFNEHPAMCRTAGYVTANPFADHDSATSKSADLRESRLAHFRPLYETEWQAIDTDPPIETVPPRAVTDHAIDAWRRRDELGIDQLVVHYMQPHEPFIARPEWSYQDPHDNAVLKNLVSEGYEAGTSPWQEMVSSGAVSVEEFWPVYKDNLRWVLDDVADRLLPNLSGDVVISADHGNGLGEWGEWHHPPGAIGPGARKVPWVEVECEDSHTVMPRIGEGDEAVDAEVNEQLESLGYL